MSEADIATKGQELFFAAKNLLMALHDLNVTFVLWLTQMFNVSIPPHFLTALETGLIFALLFGIMKLFISSMKHSAIAAAVIVAIIMLIPFIPVA